MCLQCTTMSLRSQVLKMDMKAMQIEDECVFCVLLVRYDCRRRGCVDVLSFANVSTRSRMASILQRRPMLTNCARNWVNRRCSHSSLCLRRDRNSALLFGVFPIRASVTEVIFFYLQIPSRSTGRKCCQTHRGRCHFERCTTCETPRSSERQQEQETR